MGAPLAGSELAARIETLAGCTSERGKLTRLTLTPAHRAAADLLRGWFGAAGLAVRETATGDVIGRRDGAKPGARTLILGSHVDTVRDAGRYDGALGVVAALAVAEELARAGRALPFALDVVAFADEEGVRFPSTLTGSRAMAGRFDPATLDERDADGATRRDALAAFGADPARIAAEARDPAQVLGFVEVHIEQGPVLETKHLALGVVTAIAGASRGAITVVGRAGHAGTLPMGMRCDALAAAAEMILAIEATARHGRDLVATVGRIEVPDGAVNIVPGRCVFSFDLRSPADADRHAALERIRKAAADIAWARGVKVEIEQSYDAPAAACDPALQDALEAAMAANGHAPFRLPSGAGHDAMAFRDRIPLAMLFVRCKGGVSHNPAEFCAPDDMEAAARVLHDTVIALGERA
jgi:allantoate deiminase